MFLFRDFLTGRVALSMDTATIYSVTKYYFNNILNGVVPLWDPFVLLGTPFYAITLCNLFNPVTQLVPLLKILGLNYYHAFIVYMVVFYFLGTIGFYCLGKIIFQDRRAAYVGFLLILFSGIGVSMFNQLTIVELFVPAVWFFVFLLRFARSFRLSDFLGLSFSAMTLAIAYLPFYCATLILCAVMLGGVLFFKEFKAFAAGSWLFVRRHVIVFFLCAAGLLAALSPLVVYKVIDSTDDVVSPGRHCNYSDIADCYERTLNEQGGMSYKETSQSGGLAERLHWRGLFTHLDKASYGIDQFFYVPVLVFILIILSVFIPLDRSKIFLALLAVFLTLIAMADVTPVHKFLYDRIFFFKYFRNLFFFQAYIIPLVIFFAVGQLKSLCQSDVSTFTRKKAALLWAVTAHAGIIVFFLGQDGIILTSMGTVAISAGVFIAAYLGRWDIQHVLYGGAMCLALIQPVEVFSHYSRNAQQFQCELPGGHVRPQFSFRRPTEEVKSNCKIFKFVHYESFYDSLNMKDARGYIGYPTSVTRGAYLLSQWVDEPTLLDYASHKFWLYDTARGFDAQALEIRSLADIFRARFNTAYVDPPGKETRATFTEADWGGYPPAEALDPARATVEVFNPNRLKVTLDLAKDKFVVYTDGFTKHWKVSVNDKPQELLRAQAGFKGVWVPAGKSTVDFRYEPPGGGWVYIMVTGVLLVFALWVITSLKREKNWPWEEGRA